MQICICSVKRKEILWAGFDKLEDEGDVIRRVLLLGCERNFLAFESNGSIAWKLHLAYTCNASLPPVHGSRGKNRVLNINFLDLETSLPTKEVFFGQEDAGEIIGLAVSRLSSSVFINHRNQGLFVYLIGGQGQLLWSIGPMTSQFGYRLGCRKDVTDCYFNSVPVIAQCEGSIYISNTAGELYSLSIRSPHFNWIQDLSSFDKDFTVTPGNNAHLYVTVPIKALVLALDVSTGNILWQKSIGPLNAAALVPVVDSKGWVSIGSLDGFLYSISPTGDVKKFAKASVLNHVIQVSPLLDCSGYAVYISQAEMEGKFSRVIGEYNYVSALRPKGAVFTLLVPATRGEKTKDSRTQEQMNRGRVYNQRGFTNAVIRDIDLHDDSNWVVISSSMGANHLFAINPFGGSVNFQTSDASHTSKNSGLGVMMKSPVLLTT
uniref:BCAS3 WD40 domain-containing protein n=1 Tax=Manihot esculenta TaxID=3983 RepID=A0A2C9W7S6_MANES